MIITCPLCHQDCETDSEIEVGQRVQCPFCDGKFTYGEDAHEGHCHSQKSKIKIFCHQCGAMIEVDAKYVGREAICPHCNTSIIVQDPENARRQPGIIDISDDRFVSLAHRSNQTDVHIEKGRGWKPILASISVALILISVIYLWPRYSAEHNVQLGGVQLWEDGPYWAECNVGANTPEECGYYFWWGDTIGYVRSGGIWIKDDSYYNDYYSGVAWVSSTGARMSSSPFNSVNCPTYNKSNSQLQSEGYIDSAGNLTAAHDAATAHLGAPWRMPTGAEVMALLKNCDSIRTVRNGVCGCLITGRGAYSLKSLFLPAAGFGLDNRLHSIGSCGECLSSAQGVSNATACSLSFYPGHINQNIYGSRCAGLPVRPVRSESVQ